MACVRLPWIALVCVAAASLATGRVGAAATLTTLYSFCQNSSCDDGSEPMGGVTLDATGDLFGTTARGGPASVGVAFELSAVAGQSGWRETVLHSFSAAPDGNYPQDGLTLHRGALFGMTDGGGTFSGGTVYELKPNAAKTRWTEIQRFVFGGFAGGYFPTFGNLIFDAAGEIYGITPLGGLAGGTANGVVFRLTPTSGPGLYTETVLYDFCSRTNCSDGNVPYSGPLMDGSGRIFGTTSAGGASDAGTVFELTPNADRTTWTESVLYSFCTRTNCTDGAKPLSGVILDAAGDLYGTTSSGGTTGHGAVFKLRPKGTRWTEAVLYSFCQQSACLDGDMPQGGLTRDPAGRLFGTTTVGGSLGNYGEVFELAPNAAGVPWTETVLHAFDSSTDGRLPQSTLVRDAAGTLYGTTTYGSKGGGTVFALTP